MASDNGAAIRALDIRTADRVLEIGFGHGRTLARLVALVPRGSVVGIEISEDMVERARRRLRTLVATGAVESRRRMPPRFPAQIVRSIEIFSVRLVLGFRSGERVSALRSERKLQRCSKTPAFRRLPWSALPGAAACRPSRCVTLPDFQDSVPRKDVLSLLRPVVARHSPPLPRNTARRPIRSPGRR